MTQPSTDQIIAVYEARITDIEARAAELRADVERERAERLRERDRADALADRAADMARELAQAVSEGATRERELQARAASARLRWGSIAQFLGGGVWWSNSQTITVIDRSEFCTPE